jgi:hypothetical protein
MTSRRETVMQKTMAQVRGRWILGLWLLVGPAAAAEASLTIERAEVQFGQVFIKGNGAAPGAQIFWEGGLVTTANLKKGAFSFSGVLPADCRGTLSDGLQTVAVDVLGCTPNGASAPAPVPQTGQIIPYAPGDDGDLQAGVQTPTPRFTDNGDGTVSDNLTGLTWLQNANCFGEVGPWADALSAASNLADDPTTTTTDCGLSDGSVAGDWRLPNIRELLSLVDFGGGRPTVPAGHPFLGVQSDDYWSSTTVALNPATAWDVAFDGITVGIANRRGKLSLGGVFVWPVRGAIER